MKKGIGSWGLFKNLYLSLMIPVLEEVKRSLTDFQDQLGKSRGPTCNEILKGFYHHYRRIYRYDPDGIRIIQAFQQGDLISAMSKNTREELNRVARENFLMARNIIAPAIKRKAIVMVKRKGGNRL